MSGMLHPDAAIWMQPLAMMSRRLKAFVSPALLALSLSACASFEPPRWPWEEASEAAPRRAAEPQPTPAIAKPAAKPATELSGLRPAPRPAAERETASLPATPPRLVGLSEAETADLLGRPAEEAAAPPGKIWVYKAAGCRLSVHLFPDMDKGGFYALDYTADGAKDSCLGKVAGEARKKGGALVEAAAKKG